MEAEVKHGWYIGLNQADGTTLFYNLHSRNWSLFRREATEWVFENTAKSILTKNIERGNVPYTARVIKVRTTVEEVE